MGYGGPNLQPSQQQPPSSFQGAMSIDDENCMVEIRDEEEEEEEEDPKELSPTELIRRQNEKWRQENEFTLRQLEATAPKLSNGQSFLAKQMQNVKQYYFLVGACTLYYRYI